MNAFASVVKEFAGQREQKEQHYLAWRKQREEESQALAREIDMLMERRRFREQRALGQSL